MILSETLFHRGQAVGQMLQNTNSGHVTFQPVKGHKRLAKRKWRSVNTCQCAVLKAYQRKEQL